MMNAKFLDLPVILRDMLSDKLGGAGVYRFLGLVAMDTLPQYQVLGSRDAFSFSAPSPHAAFRRVKGTELRSHLAQVASNNLQRSLQCNLVRVGGYLVYTETVVQVNDALTVDGWVLDCPETERRVEAAFTDAAMVRILIAEAGSFRAALRNLSSDGLLSPSILDAAQTEVFSL